MPGSDFEYSASLDSKQILAELKKINRSMEGLGKDGDKSFKSIGKSSGASGVAIGAVAGGVAALVTKFIELGAVAVANLAEITKESINLASQLESARITFTNIFKGDAGAAEAFLARLTQQSLELGVNFAELSGFAKSILPDTGSIEQFERLTRSATLLEKSDPEKTFADVRVALEEALSGSFTSLQGRFEIPPEVTRRIKELQGELGKVEGVIVGLDEFFQKTGQDLDSFSDTFASTGDRIKAQASVLQTIFGEPILDELTDEFATFEEFLKENQETLGLVAAAFGDVLAAVVDFVGSGLNDFLSDSDPTALLDVADTLFDLVKIGGVFLQMVVEWGSVVGEFFRGLSLGNAIFGEATGEMGSLNDILLGGLDFLAKSTAGWAGLVATIGPIVNVIKAVAAAMVDIASGDFIAASQSTAEALAAVENGFFDIQAGQDAANASYAESRQNLDALRESLNENNIKLAERRDKLNEDTSAGLGNANALLQQGAAARDAAQAQAELAEALAKIQEASAKIAESLERKLFDIEAKGQQQRLDQLIKNSEKRLDIARKNAQSIVDIERKNQQAIADAGTDLSRDEEDLARKAARDRVSISKDTAKAEIKAEEDFQNEIRSIKRKFAFESVEFERNRDAIGFLRLQRQTEREVQTAVEGRSQKVSEAKTEAEEKRHALNEQLQFELEDAKIANARKIVDLQQSLDRELENQRIKNERALEDQALAEQRGFEQFQRNQDRQVEAANLANQRKLDDLKKSLAEEFQIVAAAEAAKTELISVAAAQQKKIFEDAKKFAAIAAIAGGGGGGDDLPGFQHGGQFTVRGSGGADSQVVAFRASPRERVSITPPGARAVNLPLSQGVINNAGNTDNSIRAEVNQSMLDPAQQSAEMRLIARNEAEKTVKSILGRRR